MEEERRDNLRPVVNRVRKAIEDNLTSQLVGYGLFRDAAALPEAEVPNLTPARAAVRRKLAEAVLRQSRAVGKDDLSPEGVQRLVREAGATWVNRIAALRALEARGLLDPPAAFLSDDYGGASPRGQMLREQRAAEGETLSRDDSIRAGLDHAFRELSESVRVLFDADDEHSVIWPDASTFREVLGAFSTDVSQDDWTQPDILGWVYQYYNTDLNAELKKRKNKTTGFKYTADDIPIANQFYTPHWVVRVLTDNTLGRLWLEAQDRLPQAAQDPWRLTERRKGVPHAKDEAAAFEAWFREEPDPLKDASADRLCRFLVPLPSRPIPRAKKSPREIRVLDPACGSGHFLLYAFDVLFAMYREAEPDTDLREIPALILQHNLFGIDIDLRAAQLAAFDLYLKGRTVLAAIDPRAKFEVKGLNIVVADAHVGNDPRKTEFLHRFDADPEIKALYQKILSNLDHTNALGSLLKVRTEFEALFGRVAAKKSQEGAPSDWKAPGQQPLLDVKRQAELATTFRSHSGSTWTIESLLEELESFERELAPGQDIGSKLFFTDLERSVGLLALLSRQYDVVLMNPPYGDMPPEAKDYLKGNPKKLGHYPRTHGDLFAAFIEQGLDLATPNGFLGALVPWQYTFLSSLESIRTQILCGEARPELLQEYGYGVLDGATVGTMGTVARKLPPSEAAAVAQHFSVLERVSDRREDGEKLERFMETFPGYAADGPEPEKDWFVARLGSLQDIPGMPYAYWASDTLRALFKRFPPLDRDQKGVLVPERPVVKIADVKQGLATADDSRFVRFWWEVPKVTVGEGRRWVPFVKGGRDVCFYTRIDLIVNWENGGAEQREFGKGRYQGTEFYFRPGVTWPRVSWRLRKFGSYPGGCIFADKGSSVFGADWPTGAITGFLSSGAAVGGMLMQTPERMWEIGQVSTLPMPRVVPDAAFEARVEDLTRLHQEEHLGDETCRDFEGPELRSALIGVRGKGETSLDLSALLDSVAEAARRRLGEIELKLEDLDAAAYGLFDLGDSDRRIIEREMARRSKRRASSSTEDEADDAEVSEDGEAPGPPNEAGTDDENAGDLVARWVSFYVKRVLEDDADGIVPLSATHTEQGLILRVRAAAEKDLGQEVAAALFAQAPQHLGYESVEDWLTYGFFPWHASLYKNRPIFWMVSSEGFAAGKTALDFRACVHYLKLSSDTLPRLVSHYLEPVISYAQAQHGDAKAAASRPEGQGAKAQAEAERWLTTLDALRKLKAAIEDVIRGPEHKVKVPANAKWLARTVSEVRGGQDVGRGYSPDVDFGVKVNVTPLVEKRLLPKVGAKLEREAMLTRLHLKNFKGWEDTQPIRLAPITVFFGANSSGKSSLLQSLLLLKQTAESSDRSRVLHTGDRKTAVDLGTASDIVFNHDLSRSIEVTVGWQMSDPLTVPGSRPDHITFSLSAGLGSEGQPYVQLARYLMDGARVDLERREDGQGYDLKTDPRLTRHVGRPWPLPAPVRFYGFPDETWNYFQKAAWLADLAFALERQLARIQYVGPLRLKPERGYLWSGEKPESVGTSGELAVAALLAAQSEGRQVTRGTGKGTRYELMEATIARSLKEMGVIDQFRVVQISKHRKDYEVRVKRTPSAAEVLITDVGVGVSQMLPVLVQCYYAQPGATVFFEQPEIHLHPRVQAELADVFVDAALNGKVQFVIESHSEHFLRRLQRRVAEERISSDQVAFYVCDAPAGRSEIKALQVDELGNITNWPRDFFGDEIGDLAAMSEAAMRRRRNKK